MTPIRTLIVDDEPPARAGMRSLLAADQEIAIVGECASGSEAVRAIRDAAVDLVLLDIQMPGLDGLGVIRTIGTDIMPTVVFLTAHDRFAVDAYEHAVVDYLVKPFSADRFHLAMQRAKRAVRQRESDETAAHRSTRADRPADAPRSNRLVRLVLRLGERRWTIPVTDVDWIEADDYVARLHVGDRVHVVRESLDAFAEQLDPALFVRTHRSVIVIITRVRERRAVARGRTFLVLAHGARVPRSRRHRAHERGLLGLV